ncbi:MAG: glycosyltransferase [Nitrospirae bacterium]|nr:glycosyltransferase [Nitrospirota bacterium]
MKECYTGQATPVSIVIPVYNAESYLEECIASLLAQNYPTEKREILFIDNNSSDRSSAILQKHASKVRIIQEPTQGAAAARNRGIKQAKHELIAFIDADCTADKDWLRYLVKALTKDSEIAAVGGKILSRRPANPIEKFGETIHDHDKAINTFKPPYLMTSNMAIRRAVLDEAGLFNEEYRRGQDSELSYRLYNMACKFRYVPEALVYHANKKHLLGLFLEGFTHGVWKVKLEKEYRDTVLKDRKRSCHADYVQIIKAFSEFVSRTIASRKIAVTPLCECIFRSGKKMGHLVGSVRFKSIH